MSLSFCSSNIQGWGNHTNHRTLQGRSSGGRLSSVVGLRVGAVICVVTAKLVFNFQYYVFTHTRRSCPCTVNEPDAISIGLIYVAGLLA